MIVTCLAKSRDVRIKGGSGVHDDTKTCDFVRKLDVITWNFDGWDHREWAQALACAKQYGFRFVRVKAQTVMTEPDAETVQAGFQTSYGVDDIVPLRLILSWESSAYCWWAKPKFETICPMGQIYRENKIGPRTEPCGTPEEQLEVTDEKAPIRTVWERFVR